MAYLERSGVFVQGAVLNGVDWGLSHNPLSIVLTSECDIIHKKASYIIVASLVPAKEVITQSHEYIELIQGVNQDGVSAKKWEKISNFLNNYIHNKGITRYYFIDPAEAFEAPYLFVDFQHLRSIPYSDACKLEILAKLPTPYKEQMIVQFTSYLARIPVDRTEDTTEIIEKIITPLKRK